MSTHHPSDLPQDFILTGPAICTESHVLLDHALVIQKGQIQKIMPREALEKNLKLKNSLPHLTYPSSYFVIPGMIDLHIHGSQGSDVMDGTVEALKTIQKSLVDKGVTGFLATTMTETKENILTALHTVDQAAHLPSSHAEILGIHLEGPFLSEKRMGAQRGELICEPNIALFNCFQEASGHRIKKVTIAPEYPESLDLIRHLTSHHVCTSIGHTDATCHETQAAIDAGATQATHLFNAMRGVHHREPGPVTALLLDERVSTELILDGIHLAPEIVQLVLKIKGRERVLLVTDAMRAQCLGNGVFDLGGQPVTVKNGEARLENGVLAGSVLTLNHALRHMIEMTGCSLLDAVHMASSNPAKTLNLFDNRGSIAENKRADLVILNERYEVAQVIRASI